LIIFFVSSVLNRRGQKIFGGGEQIFNQFRMNGHIVLVGGSLAFLAVSPALGKLGAVCIGLMLAPGVIFIPGVLRGCLNFLLRRQCLPASVKTAQIRVKWEDCLEITVSAGDFQMSNPVAFHLFKKNGFDLTLIARFGSQDSFENPNFMTLSKVQYKMLNSPF
jgi:hypothetical protein